MVLSLRAVPGSRRPVSQADRALGREPLGEQSRAVERRELVVAADDVPVDQDERNGPPMPEIPHGLAESGVVVERHLVEVEAARIEQRLGADAESAPLRRIENDSWHQGA